MEVKVFLNEEKIELLAEPDQWCKEIEELGLKGQMRFTQKSNPEQKSVIPFPRMTREMETIYKELFPNQDNVLNYTGDPIPMKALEAYKLAKKEGWFNSPNDKIEVWHMFGHPDPLLVGMKYMPGPNEYYLLAQWGIELEPFEKARERFLTIAAAKFKVQVDAFLIKCKSLAESEAARLAHIMGKLKEGRSIDLDDIPF